MQSRIAIPQQPLRRDPAPGRHTGGCRCSCRWVGLGILLAASRLQAAETVSTGLASNPVAAFLLLVGVLIAAARLGGLLFQRMGLPTLLGELGAGMLLGTPWIGRLAWPGDAGSLEEIADRLLLPGGALSTLVPCVLMLLLFMIGLETDIRQVRRRRPTGMWIGVVGTLGSLLACAGVLLALDNFLPAALSIRLGSAGGLFLCMAAAFSSASLAAGTLARLRKLDSPEALGMMSAAVADRLTGMLWLAFVAGTLAIAAREPQCGFPTLYTRGALRTVLVLIPAVLACGALARHQERAPRDGPVSMELAAFLLAATLIVMGLFNRSELSLLGGAYLAGLTLAGSDWRQPIQTRLEFLHVSLVPASFALLGMRLDVACLAVPEVGLFAVVLIAAAVGGKLLGGWLPALLSGYNTRGWLRVSLGLVPRGEIPLAVATVGLLSGRIGPTALAVIILLVAVTNLAAAPLVTLAFRGDRHGIRKPFQPRMPRHLRYTFASRSAVRAMLHRLIDVLESEGFHVHLLNRHAAIYQLGKERTVIGLHPDACSLVVDCAADDQPLVNGAMLEVLAGIEHHLQELRRPLDAVELGRSLAGDGSIPERANDRTLAGMLNINTLRPRLLSDTKSAAIAELLELLDDEGLINDRHDALSAVVAREEGMSTGLEHGIAMPHARTRAVDRLVCAVGIKPEGIDFGTLDGGLARIIILLLAPLDKPAPQLQAIAHFSRLLNDQGRATLLACDTAEDMYDILTGSGSPAGQAPAPAPARAGDIAACLQWHGVALDLQGRTREAVIDQLIALCARSGVVTRVAEARKAVLSRESKGSTAMEHGLALPHARTDAVTRMVCALGISRQGVDFGAQDGQPTRIFIMVLMPVEVTVEYTRLTAGLMRALDEPGRQALLAASSGQEAVGILTRGMPGRA